MKTEDCGCRQENSEDVARRSFLTKLSIVFSSLIGLMMVLPGLGFILAPVFGRPPGKWRTVGNVDQFEVGSTVLVNFEDASPTPWAGVTAKTGAWLRRVDDSEFIAFSINCRHLGCPVRWVEAANLFMCPCHGGVYYQDGTVAGGPPPKPLKRLPVRVQKKKVQIETSPVPLTTTQV
ncbi:QcrA and Rieske domain-containing protein [Calycomorphotria hydatis]|uniref:Cytochrome b6-f complex iron-sulfur subunit n=1 Tax=Calycomorphotria hydatis TaxID=2528027 RepID=A0A517T999_9PLAN|nr:Rieske 2Fe-2S domain-containing protein [Calycomorphotria hydatis]QDT64943.1 Cytochrome b6-f complex iron-sulfur subunit [Calycomorphotria hydatis]